MVIVEYAGEGIYLFAPDQYVQPYQVRRAVTQEGVVHSPISPRGRFEFVVEVKYHLCQGQLIVKDYPLFAQVLGADVLTPALLAYLHYCAYVFTRQDYLHGHVVGVIYFIYLSFFIHYLIGNAGGRLDDVDVTLPLQPLLYHLHVEESQEAAAETKTQGRRPLRLKGKG